MVLLLSKQTKKHYFTQFLQRNHFFKDKAFKSKLSAMELIQQLE